MKLLSKLFKKNKENKFSEWNSFPAPKQKMSSSYSIAVEYLDRIYIFNYNSSLVHEYSNEKWKFYETNHRFISSYHSFVIFKGSIYFYGGTNSKSILLFHTSTKSWERMFLHPQSPNPRYLHSANVVGNKMYIYGGVIKLISI
jgi:hypothetical protein